MTWIVLAGEEGTLLPLWGENVRKYATGLLWSLGDCVW